MRLAIQEQLLPGAALKEKAAYARASGFDGIELRGRGEGDLAGRLPELRAAQRAGAVLPSVCVEMDHFIGDFDAERRRDAVVQLRSQLSVIAELGGNGVVTPASWGMFSLRLPPFVPPRSAQEDHDVLLEALVELGEHAAREGVYLWLEALNRYEDHMVNRLEQAAALAAEVEQAIGTDAVRVCADVYHMNIEEDDLPKAVHAAGARIGHVHVNDTNRLQPGTGHLDFPAVFGALHDIGYSGWAALECRLRGRPEEVLPASTRFLAPYLSMTP
jgi:sugar phosphate isomerase/epimerase